jgi:hypothetical protein
MTREFSRDTCVVADSNLCNRLGVKGCQECYVRTLKSDDQRKDANERWEETLSLMPYDIDDLHESEVCQFCKDEERKKDGYAFIEMAHSEPYAEKGMFFGFGKKVRTPVGSLVSIQVGICNHCKKAFRMGDILQIGILALSVVVGILVAYLTAPMTEPLGEAYVLIQILILVAIVIAGIYIGKQVSVVSAKRAAEKVRLNVAEIPMVGQMLQRGWFFFPESNSNSFPRVSFNKKKAYECLRFDRYSRKADEDGEEEISLDNYNI